MQWIHRLLQAGEVYSVGGSVRDALLERPFNDLDILVSGITATDLEALLNPLGQLHLAGKSFGVYVFKSYQSEVSYEIALPRVETSTGAGHKAFEVRVDHKLPIEIDLKRRDFTINAMAKSLRDGRLLDPWGGQRDLQAKLIRQVFPDTFKADPLRMLRACQFAARLDFELESITRAGIAENASLVSNLSVERVFQELQKLLNAPKPSIGLKMMQETGLVAEVLPELAATMGIAQPVKYHLHDVFHHTLAVIDAVTLETGADVKQTVEMAAPGSGGHDVKAAVKTVLTEPKLLDLRWAALCHDLGKPAVMGRHPLEDRPTFYGHETVSSDLAEQLLTRLKAPEALKTKVKILCTEHMFAPLEQMSDRALRRLIHRAGAANMLDLIYLRRADMLGSGKPRDLQAWDALLTRTRKALTGGTFTRNQLAINGQDLISSLSIKPGRHLGALLDQLLAQVVDAPRRNTRKQLLNIARGLHGSTKK